LLAEQRLDWEPSQSPRGFAESLERALIGRVQLTEVENNVDRRCSGQIHQTLEGELTSLLGMEFWSGRWTPDRARLLC
jgi:hypothetical protein